MTEPKHPSLPSQKILETAKTLSEALNIMVGMCQGAHIDAPLFALFVRSGVYRRYAERFMQAEQIDAVDEQMLLEKTGAA